MNTLKLKRRLIFLGMIAAVMFALAPCPSVLAGEPPPGAGFNFAPPPYIGDLTVSWVGGIIWINGTVWQQGQSDCIGEFDDFIIVTGGVTLEEFQALTGKDIRGLIFANIDDSDPISCLSDGGFFEVIAVGNLQWPPGDPDPTEFTAQFIIMAYE